MKTRRLILVFALINAALVSALLPLWEGFDEAFHYAYIETLWQTGQAPALGRTLVPTGVSRTFPLAPVGPVVRTWMPNSITYSEWFQLPTAEKDRRRQELDALRPDASVSTRPNYEAAQAPLAYGILALIDWSLSGLPITTRVLVLRLFAGFASVFLVYIAACRLCRTLALSNAFTNAALLTIFSSQMLYATVAHVANDWLAVGISAMFFATAAEMSGAGAFWLAAGLLTKAYFLPLTPLAFRRPHWRLAVLLIAVPWYIRNLALYHNLSGTHEEFDGIGPAQALAAALKMDWFATAGFLARGSLWTGNASFLTFSRGTLDVILALLAAALILWASRRKAIQPAERFLFVAIVLFSAVMAYASCAAFAHMKGDSPGAGPWYTQVLLLPVVLLAYVGLSRWNRHGRILAACTVALWSWVLIATWTIKLFPLYSGAPGGSMRFHDIWIWYAQGAAAHTHDLSLLALAPAGVLYTGMFVSVAMAIGLVGSVIHQLMVQKPQPVGT